MVIEETFQERDKDSSDQIQERFAKEKEMVMKMLSNSSNPYNLTDEQIENCKEMCRRSEYYPQGHVGIKADDTRPPIDISCSLIFAKMMDDAASGKGPFELANVN